MKRLLVLTILLALGSSFIGTTSQAQEEDIKRAVNPGDDPNEAKSSRALEADVAAVGNCSECLARLKHTRLSDDTTFRARGEKDSSSNGNSSGVKGTR